MTVAERPDWYGLYFGTITRTGGSRQLTCNGHPLCSYLGDSAPGQANGNNLNLNGGLWREVRVP